MCSIEIDMLRLVNHCLKMLGYALSKLVLVQRIDDLNFFFTVLFSCISALCNPNMAIQEGDELDLKNLHIKTSKTFFTINQKSKKKLNPIHTH